MLTRHDFKRRLIAIPVPERYLVLMSPATKVLESVTEIEGCWVIL
jgi:hypothetical protein